MAHNSNNETYLVELLFILLVWVYYFQIIRFLYRRYTLSDKKIEYLIKG